MPKRKYGSMYGSRKRSRRTPRKVFKRRSRRIQIGKPSRGLRQSTYLFKRRITTVVNLSNADSGGWISSPDNKAMYKQWNFKLQDLAGVDSTDFTNLFRRYRINAAKVEMAFSNTGSVPDAGGNAGNFQLQLYTRANRSGRSEENITEQSMLNTQASKKRLCLNNGRPIKYYMKLNQLAETFANTGGVPNSDYTVQRPRYVSTGEVGCEHYGLDMFINRVDGQALGTNLATDAQKMRCTITYYMSFKGVE
jgi:hypothetical protein